MSYVQRFCQGSSLRQAASAWRAGVSSLQAARVAVVASQRVASFPSFSAPPQPVSGFSSAPSITMSFAASGLQSTSASGSSTSLETGEGEGGNSLGGASHTGSLTKGRFRKRRKRF